MHPEINTHNKIKANIFGFAVIPPQFSSNVRYSEKAFGQRKIVCILFRILFVVLLISQTIFSDIAALFFRYHLW